MSAPVELAAVRDAHMTDRGLRELRDQLAELELLHGVERARCARDLHVGMVRAVALAGDEGIWEASRRAPGRRAWGDRDGLSYAQIARAMGNSPSSVSNITRAVMSFGRAFIAAIDPARPGARWSPGEHTWKETES